MMKAMSGEEIVSTFLDFFQKRGHLKLQAESLLPQNDPSLLYINSGMAPLKPYFLGLATPPQRQLCNVQRCIRTNDIDSVGDRHHLTFFEMLGSWSIGDYWKDRAIELAWELLVEGFGFPRERLYATVYKGDPALGIPPDEDSADFWRAVGMPDDHIVLLGEDNFWGPAGQWGPCGPCTEVFFDTGEEFGETYRPGGVFDDKSRYIEIWNAGVFMQYDKQPDGMRPLDIRSVDTGSGVERMAMAINGYDSCYETDLLKPLVDYAREQLPANVPETALRVIADHARAATMILADGGTPSAIGAGYIPRRLIRRAVAMTAQADNWDFDFAGLVDLAIGNAKSWNPHVPRRGDAIRSAFQTEVQDFHKTLKSGLQRLAAAYEEEPEMMRGGTAFKLFSTYGIPIDVIREYVVSRGGKLDSEDFEKELRGHQLISRIGQSQDAVDHYRVGDMKVSSNFAKTDFHGYELEMLEGEILALYQDGQQVDVIAEGGKAVVIVDRTPFYAESGGQVGDTGMLATQSGTLRVHDTRKIADDRIIHIGEVTQGKLRVGEAATLEIDADRRRNVRANHSATHLLHEALRRLLGEHVAQKGSLVADDRLRFDFSHRSPLTSAELRAIESEVNREVRDNTVVEVGSSSMDDALQRGALALFGEKYDSEVRVVTMGGGGDSRRFSVELCGGTHVLRTGEIGLFKIVSEGAVAAGVRRIEAVTGAAAEDYVASIEDTLQRASEAAHVSPAELPNRVVKLQEERRTLERELKKAQQKALSSGTTRELTKDIGGVKLIRRVIDGMTGKDLKGVAESMRNTLESGVVAVVAREGDKASLVVGVTSDLTDRVSAIDLVRSGALLLGGKGGGGRPDMAQAGGPNREQSEAALDAVEEALSTFA